MQNFLRKPYPIEKTAERRLSAAILFGLFIFAFLFFFRPFGIAQLPDRIFFVSLVFGLISSAVMLFFSFVLTELFPKYFNEKQWNIGREMLWLVIHILVIAIFNAFFAVSVNMGNASFLFFVRFLFYTIAIGVFPVTVSVLLTEMQLSKRYTAESQSMSDDIAEHPNASSSDSTEVILESDNKDEDLKVNADSILVLAAADNYAEVYYLKAGEVKKHLLRTTMKNLEEDLEHFPGFLRVHKSFIVNLSHVEKISGNAQGYKLHFAGYPDLVPVARKNNAVFRQQMSQREK